MTPTRMHGHLIRRPYLRKARVEIIPLIDVIFFLLATFVLFTLSLNRIRSLPVTLPSAGEKPSLLEPVTIQVSGDGALYWNHELIDRKEVRARIAHYKTQTDDPRVLIAGDDKARLGATVGVLDEIRKAGIEKFSVETRTRPTGR